MEAKCKIMSTQRVKPSSTTPSHLKHFKLSFLDQLAPNQYVPFLLFYSKSDVSGYGKFTTLCDKLKDSLSNLLTFYYPFCGRIKENSYVDCNDEGVLFIESKISCSLTNILEHPKVNLLKKLLPLDPFGSRVNNGNDEESAMMAIQVSELSCGGIVLGVCLLHKVADGIATASFLNAWVEMANKVNDNTIIKPYMEASLLFPTRDMEFSSPLSGRVDNKELTTLRLVFDGTSMFRLKSEMGGYNPTKVEAVTALIWKSMMEATIARSRAQEYVIIRSLVTHVVNIRTRVVPTLPERNIGNIVQLAVTPLIEHQVRGSVSVELKDLAMMVRKAIMRFDGDYVSKIKGDGGFDVVVESMKQVMPTHLEGVQWCDFTSWTRFPLYEANFGWGIPTWVSTVGMPVKNNVTLLATKCGEGIEAWVNLDEEDMVEFERNQKLLEYALIHPPLISLIF
ncbi:vinorine synthase-like [Abrus precatorius]|uniref:Vinorine synthase-like n=1 Tax=Abrus precatorius TaxID=3816 RepID=A0A8B8M5P0_ABRPR|nr:vinorine synthase-like [Abrus precatorius]